MRGRAIVSLALRFVVAFLLIALVSQSAVAYQVWTHPKTFAAIANGFSTSEIGIDVGPDGSIYFADSGTHVVGRIFPDGSQVILAGSPGAYGSQDGTGSAARFSTPTDVAVDSAGNLIVTDSGNQIIRKVTPDGVVTTIAGRRFYCAWGDGPGTSSYFCTPSGVAIGSDGSYYVADSGNHRIRRIAPGGEVTTVAGGSYAGSADGTGSTARFSNPTDLITDGANVLYVADERNHSVRRIDLTTRQVTTVAGGAPGYQDGYNGSMFRPRSIARDADGTLFVTDGNNSVRRIDSQRSLSTVGGVFYSNADRDGTGSEARFISVGLQNAGRLAMLPGGALFVTDGSGKVKRGTAAIGDEATVSSTSAAVGSQVQLGSVPTTATSWQWSIVFRPDGSVAQVSDPAIAEPTFTPDTAGYYEFRLDAVSASGSSITYASLDVYCPTPAPVVTILSGTNPSCSADAVTLQAEAGFDGYLWSNGETTQSITVEPSARTTYMVRGYRNGCWSYDRAHTQDVKPAPTPSVYVSGSTALCYGGTGASFAAYSGEAGTSQWQWGYRTPENSTFVPLSGDNYQTFLLDSKKFPSAGTYDVSCQMTSACGDPIETPLTRVEFRPLPEVTITPSSPVFCEGGSVTLTGNVTSGSAPYRTYTWHYETEGGVTTPTPSLVATRPGRYQLVVTDQYWCTTVSDAVTVTMLPQATVTPSGPTTFCEGQSVTLTASEGTGYLWSNGATTQSITVNASGSYAATVTTEAGCGSTTTAVDVVVLPAPEATITPSGPTSFCLGGEVTLTASAGSSYSWSNGATTQSIVVNASGEYSVTVTNGDGCSASSSPTVVTVHDEPVAPIITPSGSTTLCEGGSVTLTAPESASYLWSNGATSRSIVVSAAGSYSVVVGNANGCTATSSPIEVSVNPAPVPTITAHQVYAYANAAGIESLAGAQSTYEFCGPASVRLVSSPASSYVWSTGETTPAIVINTSGVYSVTVTDANGCAGTTSVSVTIADPPAPTITASGPTTFCSPGSVTLTASTAASYLWSTGATTQSITVSDSGEYGVTVTDGLGCTRSSSTTVTVRKPIVTQEAPTSSCPTGTVTLTSTPASSYLWSTGETTQSIAATASGSYAVTATYDDGCASTSDSFEAVVEPMLAATIAGPTAICEGEEVTMTAQASGGNGAYTYQWHDGRGAIPGATGETYTTAPSSNDYFYVQVFDAMVCSTSSGALSLTVHPTPDATIAAPAAMCVGSTTSVSVPHAGAGATYEWTISGGTIESTMADGSVAFFHADSAATNVTIGITITTAAGCTTTATPVSIAVETPVATIASSGATTFCEGSSVTLTASGAASYLWSTGATTQSITVDATGTYGVTITTANGCSASVSQQVTVHSADVPTIAANGPTSFCEGGSVTLTASPASSYLWSNGAATQSITVSVSGSYSVTTTNANGCSATSASTSVSTYAKPTATISASGPTTFCEGGSVTLTASPASSYLWSNGATTQSIVVSAAGSYSVTTTNANGCSATSASTSVATYAKPTATISASGPTTFCEGGSVTLTASAASSYLWSTGATTQTIVVSASGSYSVTTTNANGCSATSAPTSITTYAKPTATISASGPTTFCEGGSVTLTASPASSYLWSTGATTQSITVSATGSYSVTTTNANGCSATSASVSVTENPLPAQPVVTPSGPTTFCEGGSVTLTAPAGYGYLWSNGATTQTIVVAASGGYSVTITNGSGCSTTSAPQLVTVNPATVITQQPQSVTVPKNSTHTLTALASGAGAVSYQWYQGVSGDTSSPIAGATSSNYTTRKLTRGTYSYWVRATAGCGSTNSATATITAN